MQPRPGSILDLLVSIVTLAISNDWVKLAVFGGIIEVARRMMSLLYLKIWDSIFINVYFQQEDPSYGSQLCSPVLSYRSIAHPCVISSYPKNG